MVPQAVTVIAGSENALATKQSIEQDGRFRTRASANGASKKEVC